MREADIPPRASASLLPGGLRKYGFRYYSPETGRWLNRDPLGERGGLNPYAFVENNPIGAFDPVGLQSMMFVHGFPEYGQGPERFSFAESVFHHFFDGNDLMLPFETVDRGWEPADFPGWEDAVREACNKGNGVHCLEFPEQVQFLPYKHNLRPAEGRYDILRLLQEAGPGRVGIVLKGCFHVEDCEWEFRGKMVPQPDLFNFDPAFTSLDWFRSAAGYGPKPPRGLVAEGVTIGVATLQHLPLNPLQAWQELLWPGSVPTIVPNNEWWITWKDKDVKVRGICE